MNKSICVCKRKLCVCIYTIINMVKYYMKKKLILLDYSKNGLHKFKLNHYKMEYISN